MFHRVQRRRGRNHPTLVDWRVLPNLGDRQGRICFARSVAVWIPAFIGAYRDPSDLGRLSGGYFEFRHFACELVQSAKRDARAIGRGKLRHAGRGQRDKDKYSRQAWYHDPPFALRDAAT